MIIEIPKQRNVTILPQFAIVDKSSYHAARINVSRNREFKITTTATATGTSLNKRFNEQNNSCARAL